MVLRAGIASQEVGAGKAAGRGGGVADQAFFPREFLVQLVSMYTFSCIRCNSLECPRALMTELQRLYICNTNIYSYIIRIYRGTAVVLKIGKVEE